MSSMFDELDYDNLSDSDKEWLRSWNQPVPDDEDVEEDEDLILDLGPLNKPQLVREAEKRDLDTSGTKLDLQTRIEEYDAEQGYYQTDEEPEE